MAVRALEELQLGFDDLPDGNGARGQLAHVSRGPYPPPPVAGAPKPGLGALGALRPCRAGG